jgi:hypothetical protein
MGGMFPIFLDEYIDQHVHIRPNTFNNIEKTHNSTLFTLMLYGTISLKSQSALKL